MTDTAPTKRLHPMMAVAAASVTLFSLLGIAAITGLLPTSRGAAPESMVREAQPETAAPVVAKAAEPPKKAQVVQTVKKPVAQQAAQPTAQAAPAAPQVAAAPAPAPAPAPQVATAPAKAEPQHSPIGIGVGAVIGGVLGNQIGSGDGKTLATIAGAIGGGYIGNEVAKNSKP